MKNLDYINLHKIKHLIVFLALHNLALTYQEGGKYDQAIKTYQESLKLDRRCDDGNLVEMSASTYRERRSDFHFSNYPCWDI